MPMRALAAVFVCAMPMEQRPLTSLLGLSPGTIGDLPAKVGSLEGHRVASVVTGMGTALAGRATERVLDAAPDRLVVVGIAGAVENETPIGTVVLPEVVIDGASGAEHRHQPLAAAPQHGAMWTTDTVTPAEALPRLRARGVVALDMETAAVAEHCEAAGVPWSVYRAFSDRATDGSVDDEVFGLSRPDGTPDGQAVLRYLRRHPGRVPRLVRLGLGSQRATRHAAAAAVDALRAALG